MPNCPKTDRIIDVLRYVRAQFDLLDVIRIILFALLTAICFYQLRQSLDEINESPTVSVVVLDNLHQIRFPTLTVCHKTPFTQIDYHKLNQTYGISQPLVDALSVGSGMLPLQGYCHRNYITGLTDGNAWFNWTDLGVEYEELKLASGLDDSQLMKHILMNFSHPCEQNFDDANFWPEPLDPEPGNISGQLECKDGFMSRTWSIERGLCWSVNTSVLPATSTLAVFPTVPVFDRYPNSEYYGKYLQCIDTLVEVFISHGREAKPRSYFEGPLHEYKGFEIEVSTIKASGECHAWQPKYLPEIFGTFPYSISNCEADIAVDEYFVKKFKCLPAVYQNPDNLPICSPLDLAQKHFDVVQRKVPYPKPLSLERIRKSCPQPCAKRRSYTYTQRGSSTSERRFHLEMTFSSFDSWLSVQKEQNTMESYFGQIGGLLGLWIGFSVFSLYDYLTAVYRLYAKLRDKQITVQQAKATANKSELAVARLLCSTFGHQLKMTSELLSLSSTNLHKLQEKSNQFKELKHSGRRRSSA